MRHSSFASRTLPLIVVAALYGCGSDSSSVAPPPPAPAYLALVTGDNQSAAVTERLTDSLVVRLATADGKPVVGKGIDWTVTTTPGGELSQASSRTNAKGEAFVVWTMGTSEGEVAAKAVYAPTGSAVDFHAMATPRLQPLPPPPPALRTLVLHSDGSSWKPSLVLPEFVKGTALWGLGSSRVYAGLFGCPDLVVYSGTWQSNSCGIFGREVYGIWGPAEDHLYAIERGLGPPITRPQYVYHFDGHSWDIVHRVGELQGESGDLLAISGRGTTEVIAVGRSGEIVRLIGSNWSVQPSGTTNDLFGVWGDPNGGAAVAVGNAGTILYNDGSAWVTQSSGTIQALTGVWGSSPRDIFAVGTNGTILHYNGTSWTPQASGTTATLRAVWAGSNGSAIAVGDQGTILRYNGVAWTAENSGVTTNLIAVWGSSPSDVFVVSQ